MLGGGGPGPMRGGPGPGGVPPSLLGEPDIGPPRPSLLGPGDHHGMRDPEREIKMARTIVAMTKALVSRETQKYNL